MKTVGHLQICAIRAHVQSWRRCGTSLQSLFATDPQRLAKRFAEVAKGWAVDEDMLFSAVAHAIEDRYPLGRYYVGFSPILLDLSVYIPFFWVFRAIVQWLLRIAIVSSYYRARGDDFGTHVNRFLGL